MSPKNRLPMQIALPPRLSFSLSRVTSGELSPCTPSPHTPLPHEFAFTPELAAQHATNGMHLDDLEVSALPKRTRDDDYEWNESEWTAEEMDVLESTLMHPFRALSQHYPPGDLPPPNAIDELTNQILTFAFRSSPARHKQEGWTHTWDATRRKLFELALANSKFGGDAAERKERKAKPGLRRVDSMDFLNERPEKGSDNLGKALRLSTSLQNSAKQDPVLVSMCRSAPLSALAGSSSSPTTSVTLTPSSPQTFASSSVHRRSSLRASQTRYVRPASLLQRGRSFTASDLQAEVEVEAQGAAAEEAVIEECPKPQSQEEKKKFSTSLESLLPPNPSLLHSRPVGPRPLTRSHSSSSAFHPRPHTARDAFLSPTKPSSTNRSVLAMPLPVPLQEPKSSSEWSDSEDDTSGKAKRAVKKIKGGRPKPRIALPLVEKVRAEQLPFDGGLRSPFEEKAELQF